MKNVQLRGMMEELDLETKEASNYLVFVTEEGRKFTLPVPPETVRMLIKELAEEEHEEPGQESEEEEAQQQPETDFDNPPTPPPPAVRGRIKPPPPARVAPPPPSGSLEVDPVDLPEGATVFGDPNDPPPFELHETSTQSPLRTRMTEAKVPGL